MHNTRSGRVRLDSRCRRALALALTVSTAWACRSAAPAAPPPPVSSPGPSAEPSAAPEPTPAPRKKVRQALEEVVVAAWAEPARLAEGGGQVQILVRLQRRSGRAYPGVDVQLLASQGQLYSQGHVLTTNANGMTRDRLTTRRTATVTVNAGGTRYRFKVAVAPDVIER